MGHLITDLLNERAAVMPDRTAYVSPARTATFAQVREEAMKVAQGLISLGLRKKPVAILAEKSIECVGAIFGVAYSGNFYTVIDTEMPDARVDKILSTLKPAAIVTVSALKDKAEAMAADNAQADGPAAVLVYEELQSAALDEAAVLACASRILPSDIIYVLFTSGSTGMPKGVITSHFALSDYMQRFPEMYLLDDTDSYLSQAPFYFVMALHEIFGPVAFGATTHIVPAMAYMFPGTLVKYIEEHKITVLNWVPSALAMIVNMNGFAAGDLSSVRRVLFGGEVMPMRVVREWRKQLPHAKFLNGYGATELVDGAIAYWVEKDFPDGATLPIGKALPHMDIMLLDADDHLITEKHVEGEICARSASLSLGYYGEPEKTAEVFVQNPLNPYYEEKIYRTGDLAVYNDEGDLEYVGRKDFQIKYMGHRIELGEIEANVSAVRGITENACLYDAEKKLIVLYFEGSLTEKEVGKILTEDLPGYMQPRRIFRLEKMPHNAHGKIDRAGLKERMAEDTKSHRR